jgi:hypothetical protein
MDRNLARTIFENTKRFPSSGGRIKVRDAELAAMIAAVRADRLPLCPPPVRLARSGPVN